MAVPYASIATAVEAVATLAFKIYSAWKDAPDILQRVSRELESVYLLLQQLHSESRDGTSTINRYGAHQKTNFEMVIVNIKHPLEYLNSHVENYKRSGRSAWQRILIGGLVKEQIKDNLDEIQHHVSYLQMIHLSFSDGERYLRLDNHIDEFCQEEAAKEEGASTIFSLEDEEVKPEGWEELWEELLPKLERLHYEAVDIRNHKKDILAYINYKSNVIRKERGARGRRGLMYEQIHEESGESSKGGTQDLSSLTAAHPVDTLQAMKSGSQIREQEPRNREAGQRFTIEPPPDKLEYITQTKEVHANKGWLNTATTHQAYELANSAEKNQSKAVATDDSLPSDYVWMRRLCSRLGINARRDHFIRQVGIFLVSWLQLSMGIVGVIISGLYIGQWLSYFKVNSIQYCAEHLEYCGGTSVGYSAPHVPVTP